MADFRWTRQGAWVRNMANPDGAWSTMAPDVDTFPPLPDGHTVDEWREFDDTTTAGPDGWEGTAGDGTRFIVFRGPVAS